MVMVKVVKLIFFIGYDLSEFYFAIFVIQILNPVTR